MTRNTRMLVGGLLIAVLASIGVVLWRMQTPVTVVDTSTPQLPLASSSSVNSTKNTNTSVSSKGQVSTLSDAQLIVQLMNGMNALMVEYDTELGFKMSALNHEYVTRGLSNRDVDDLAATMVTTYGPCWGIPEGECRE